MYSIVQVIEYNWVLSLHNLMEQCVHGRNQKGDLKNHKNTGFLSNTGPDPLKNHKATKPAFNVGSSSARQHNAYK